MIISQYREGQLKYSTDHCIHISQNHDHVFFYLSLFLSFFITLLCDKDICEKPALTREFKADGYLSMSLGINILLSFGQAGLKVTKNV